MKKNVQIWYLFMVIQQLLFWRISSFYNHTSVGHVEAGLRSGNKYAPFPEEINRQMVSNIADLHFAPTIGAKRNLIQENKDKTSIVITGNTAIDTLNFTINKNYTSELIEKHKNKNCIADRSS